METPLACCRVAGHQSVGGQKLRLFQAGTADRPEREREKKKSPSSSQAPAIGATEAWNAQADRVRQQYRCSDRQRNNLPVVLAPA